MKNRFTKPSLALAIAAASLSTSQVFAAGFQLNEHSVSALGRANAGAASMADNAAVLARNPAASTQFDSVELSVTLHQIDPDINVKGTNTVSESGVGTAVAGSVMKAAYENAGGDATAFSTYVAQASAGQPPSFAIPADAGAFQAANTYVNSTAGQTAIATNTQAALTGYAQVMTAGGHSENASATDVAPSATVPGLYVAIPVSEKLAFGIAANSYFGLKSDFGNSYAGSEHAGETSIETMYLTPSVAYKVTDSVSVGLGLQYIHGTGKLSNYASPQVEAISSVLAQCADPTDLSNCNAAAVVPQGTTLIDLEGDGDAFGVQVGLLWEISDDSSIGFRYQSEVEMEFDGDITYLPLAASNGGNPEGKGSLTIDLPQMAEIGYTGKIADKWTLHGTVLFTGWSSFEELVGDIDTANVGEVHLKDEMWDDALSYSIGVDYDLSERTVIRAGVAYDESPVADEYRTLTIPDADRMWYSIGATVQVGETGSIDASLLYIDGKSGAEVNEEFVSNGVALTEFEGELGSVGATVFSLAYNHKF